MIAKIYCDIYKPYNQFILNFEKRTYDRYDHEYERISKKYQWIIFDKLLLLLCKNYEYNFSKYDEDKNENYIVSNLKEKIGKIYPEFFSLSFEFNDVDNKKLNNLEKHYDKKILTEQDLNSLIIYKNNLLLNLCINEKYENNIDSSFYIMPSILEENEDIEEIIPKFAGELWDNLNITTYQSNIFDEQNISNLNSLFIPKEHDGFSQYDYRFNKKSSVIINKNIVNKFNLVYKNGKYYKNEEILFEYLDIGDDNLILICSNIRLLKQLLKTHKMKFYMILVHWFDIIEYGSSKEKIDEICTVNILEFNNNKFKVKNKYYAKLKNEFILKPLDNIESNKIYWLNSKLKDVIDRYYQ